MAFEQTVHIKTMISQFVHSTELKSLLSICRGGGGGGGGGGGMQ